MTKQAADALAASQEKERLALQGLQREWEASDEFYYDPYFEQEDTDD